MLLICIFAYEKLTEFYVSCRIHAAQLQGYKSFLGNILLKCFKLVLITLIIYIFTCINIVCLYNTENYSNYSELIDYFAEIIWVQPQQQLLILLCEAQKICSGSWDDKFSSLLILNVFCYYFLYILYRSIKINKNRSLLFMVKTLILAREHIAINFKKIAIKFLIAFLLFFIIRLVLYTIFLKFFTIPVFTLLWRLLAATYLTPWIFYLYNIILKTKNKNLEWKDFHPVNSFVISTMNYTTIILRIGSLTLFFLHPEFFFCLYGLVTVVLIIIIFLYYYLSDSSLALFSSYFTKKYEQGCLRSFWFFLCEALKLRNVSHMSKVKSKHEPVALQATMAFYSPLNTLTVSGLFIYYVIVNGVDEGYKAFLSSLTKIDMRYSRYQHCIPQPYLNTTARGTNFNFYFKDKIPKTIPEQTSAVKALEKSPCIYMLKEIERQSEDKKIMENLISKGLNKDGVKVDLAPSFFANDKKTIVGFTINFEFSVRNPGAVKYTKKRGLAVIMMQDTDLKEGGAKKFDYGVTTTDGPEFKDTNRMGETLHRIQKEYGIDLKKNYTNDYVAIITPISNIEEYVSRDISFSGGWRPVVNLMNPLYRPDYSSAFGMNDELAKNFTADKAKNYLLDKAPYQNLPVNHHYNTIQSVGFLLRYENIFTNEVTNNFSSIDNSEVVKFFNTLGRTYDKDDLRIWDRINLMIDDHVHKNMVNSSLFDKKKFTIWENQGRVHHISDKGRFIYINRGSILGKVWVNNKFTDFRIFNNPESHESEMLSLAIKYKDTGKVYGMIRYGLFVKLVSFDKGKMSEVKLLGSNYSSGKRPQGTFNLALVEDVKMVNTYLKQVVATNL